MQRFAMSVNLYNDPQNRDSAFHGFSRRAYLRRAGIMMTYSTLLLRGEQAAARGKCRVLTQAFYGKADAATRIPGNLDLAEAAHRYAAGTDIILYPPLVTTGQPSW